MFNAGQDRVRYEWRSGQHLVTDRGCSAITGQAATVRAVCAWQQFHAGRDGIAMQSIPFGAAIEAHNSVELRLQLAGSTDAGSFL